MVLAKEWFKSITIIELSYTEQAIHIEFNYESLKCLLSKTLNNELSKALKSRKWAKDNKMAVNFHMYMALKSNNLLRHP